MKHKIIAGLIAAAFAAASPVFSPAFAAGSTSTQVSGAARSPTVTVTLTPDASVLGQTGNVYVFADIAGVVYFKNGAGIWERWAEPSQYPSYKQGALNAQQVAVLAGELETAAVVGARFFVGYGRSQDEMLFNGWIHEVYDAAPSNLLRISSRYYDGVGNDLLTAGLGQTGIGSATSPAARVGFSATNPEDIRQLTIYNNYRALVDSSAAGGYGTLYGPNVANDGTSPFNNKDGKIAGTESLGLLDPGDGSEMVSVMVQIPDSFDRNAPCLVTATSSGSRGVYGAIGTAGDWGLKSGCAVVYNDKGSGNGAHALDTGMVTRAEGTATGVRANAFNPSGLQSILYPHFLARNEAGKAISPDDNFNYHYPGRYAFKQAHSMRNLEKNWGTHVLDSVRFALNVLNEKFGGTGPSGLPNTVFVAKGKEGAGQTGVIVIASSVSNGGGAALRAAEQDTDGLITAVAVSEPQVQPDTAGRTFSIVSGTLTLSNGQYGKSLYEVVTQYALYQPCASLANPGTAQYAALNALGQQANRCKALAENGLLPGVTGVDTATPASVSAAAGAAQKVLNDYGFLPEQNPIAPSYEAFRTHSAVAVTYANAYGRFAVTQNLCNYSFGATSSTGRPVPLDPALDALLFASGNGIPPTGGVSLINNVSVGWPLNDNVSISPGSGRADLNFDGVRCLRKYALGADPVTGAALAGGELANYQRIQAGIAEVRASGNLRGKPAIIVQGRSDALIPVNHAGRPYFGLNQAVEGAASQLRYIEVTNGHHLDAFNGFYPSLAIPLHVYLVRALNAVHAHLKSGTALPASQVVRTTTRAGASEAMSAAKLPAFAATPGADAIVFGANSVQVPQ